MKRAPVAALAALLLMTVSAQAEGIYVGVPMGDQATSFTWDGLFIGGGTGTELWQKPGLTEHKVDGYAYFGGNVTVGNFLFGAEAFLNAYYAFEPKASSTRVGATARAGYLVTPQAVLYVEAGGFHDFNFAAQPITGIGAEFAVADQISIDATYDYVWRKGPKATAHQLSLSALWHFN